MLADWGALIRRDRGALPFDSLHGPDSTQIWRKLRDPNQRSSRKIQQELEHIRKRFWKQRSSARGFISTKSGGITVETIISYLVPHSAKTA